MENISLITTLLIVFTAAIVGGVVARKLSVPMLLGYIAAGIFFGNLLPTFVDARFLGIIADVGVTLLLFTLGVEFSFRRLRGVIGVIMGAAITQILLSFLFFFLFFVYLSTPVVSSVFLAVAVSLSSTAVVVKMLSERGELETIPGEVLIGWLVVQDLAVIPIMVILPALVTMGQSGITELSHIGAIVGTSIGKAGIFLALVFLLGGGIPKILSRIAGVGSREIFLLSTVAIVFLCAIVSVIFGLSAAIGAFIAGLLISETSQHHAVFAEVRPLRDIFAVVFFVTIGMNLPIAFLIGQAPKLMVLTVIIVAVKWCMVMGLMRFLGYHRKTSFLVSLGLLPMSEFGFIIAREGMVRKALTTDQFVFLVALTFLTIFVGGPLLVHGQRLYYWWEKSVGKRLPKFFAQKEPVVDDGGGVPLVDHVVICGFGRVGKYIGRALVMAGVPFVVVDYNHTTVRSVRSEGIAVVYGDPADSSVLSAAGVAKARAIIVAIPDKHTQEMVIAGAQTLNKRIRIICRTHHEEDQRRLKSLGVTTIVQPEFEAAITMVERILPDFGVPQEELPGKIARLKIEHGLG